MDGDDELSLPTAWSTSRRSRQAFGRNRCESLQQTTTRTLDALHHSVPMRRSQSLNLSMLFLEENEDTTNLPRKASKRRVVLPEHHTRKRSMRMMDSASLSTSASTTTTRGDDEPRSSLTIWDDDDDDDESCGTSDTVEEDEAEEPSSTHQHYPPTDVPHMLAELSKPHYDSTFILLPFDWSSERKHAFLHWGQTLGLQWRCLGSGLVCLQCSLAKGKALLEELQRTTNSSEPSSVSWHTTAIPTAVLPTTDPLAQALQAMGLHETNDRTTATAVTRTVTLDPSPPRVLSRPSAPHPIGLPTACLETPLPPAAEEGWGSRPIPGRDWGTSDQPLPETLQTLLERFQEATLESPEKEAIPCVLPGELPEPTEPLDRRRKRREQSLAAHRRRSLWAAASREPLVSLSRPLFRGSLAPQPLVARLSRTHEFVVSRGMETEPLPPLAQDAIVSHVFGFLDDLSVVGRVCTHWADLATTTQAQRLLVDEAVPSQTSLARLYSWTRFLSEGTFKKVYLAHHRKADEAEALSVMDKEQIVDLQTVQAELVVSTLLSGLVRRGICPNFILTRDVFTCAHEPTEDLSEPCGIIEQGRYYCLRMELCDKGDAEEFTKTLEDELIPPSMARCLLFQMAFALHVAAEKHSLKHYDMKLLNVFVKALQLDHKEEYVARYGVGAHVFALRMPSSTAWIAKVADYGTANIKTESNGQPVTIAQFTTQENTPPDYLILGDEAVQGHGHDNFGLGLCMLHLFTGSRPYEEILENVKCPRHFRKKLKKIWESEHGDGYSVLQMCILSDVYKDEEGNIIEGDPDETLYDTLYRFLVLFGIPDTCFGERKRPQVWQAISEALEGIFVNKKGHTTHRKQGTDVSQFRKDQRMFSLASGTDPFIARARASLEALPGGMDLLYRLCHFDPSQRATAMDVLNSEFMEALRETPGTVYDKDTTKVDSYLSLSLQTPRAVV